MDDDWGLNAVVRGCSASLSAAPSQSSVTTTAYVADFDFQSFNSNSNNTPFLFAPSSSSSSSSSSPSFGKSQNSQTSGQLFSLSSDPTATRPRRNNDIGNNNRVVVEDLHELYKPFFIPHTKPESNNGSSQISSFTTTTTILNDQMRPLKQLHNNITPSPKNSHAGSVSSSTAPRSKKRKNQMKKVCQVPAESLSSDIWAWRKYGQKPIKGSPYPRGYYRCSSSKGCLARKQVERNRSDPAMFIVTYTSEHNHPAPTHRNSLAGSTRQKPSIDPSKPLEESSIKLSSSPATSSPDDDLAAALSGSATESKDGPESSTMVMEDEEEDEFGISDMAVSDDFFVGLEGLGSPVTGDFSSEGLPASFGLPWSAGSAAAAAGGR